MAAGGVRRWPLVFALIYFTFFLDNVLLTVLVPIIPDWVRGSSLAAWSAHEAPLASLLNATLSGGEPGGGTPGGAAQAVVGAVLGAKAAAQLAAAAPAADAVRRWGAPVVLRLATTLLLLASVALAACSGRSGVGVTVAAAGARAAHGAAAAAASVAGLALAAAAAPAGDRRPLAALLGAVALGVLVGYPLGGASVALGGRAAPFLLIAGALALNLALQWLFLNTEELTQLCVSECVSSEGWRGARAACAGCAGPCAGAVLLTTSVMAALEPCLPLWLVQRFHPGRWVTGAVFIPDSAAYLAATILAGGVAREIGAERVALAGQLAVAAGALWLPHAQSVQALAFPHIALGAGLGSLDAALVPALMDAAPARAPYRAALLQAASAVAYALGPAMGGVLAWLAGFETTLRSLAVANLLYAAFLYRALARDPLSPQWGAPAADETCSEPETPDYRTFH